MLHFQIIPLQRARQALCEQKCVAGRLLCSLEQFSKSFLITAISSIKNYKELWKTNSGRVVLNMTRVNKKVEELWEDTIFQQVLNHLDIFPLNRIEGNKKKKTLNITLKR